jgi:leucyl aminopeptidase
MEIEWRVAPTSEWDADVLLFFAVEAPPSEETPIFFGCWGNEAGSWANRSQALMDFRGKAEQTSLLYAPEGRPGVQRVLCAGLGPVEKLDLERWRGVFALALRKCRELGLRRVALPVDILAEFSFARLEAVLEEAVIGALLGLYRYEAGKTKDVAPIVDPETFILMSETEPGEIPRSAAMRAEAVAAGVRLARDLTFAPGNRATPSFLLETARALAERHGFRLNAIEAAEARTMGMGAFTAVAQGSREPAYIIVIDSAPPGAEEDRPLVLVGKGVTFDSGGVSLKPVANMDAMKHDMAGAAAVLGAFEALGRLRERRRVVGILPCTENMPDGAAFKPGDVLTTLAGHTVEVITTDAEGRLVLADSIAYAARVLNPEVIIDIATLTGACIVALGERVGAIMGNREELARKIQEAAMEVGERFWPFPLWDFYFDALKSDVADFKNTGGRPGGAIIAGAFLKRFVPDGIAWVHLDIAGPAWTDRELPATPKGATGFGVRTFVEVVRRWPMI